MHQHLPLGTFNTRPPSSSLLLVLLLWCGWMTLPSFSVYTRIVNWLAACRTDSLHTTVIWERTSVLYSFSNNIIMYELWLWFYMYVTIVMCNFIISVCRHVTNATKKKKISKSPDWTRNITSYFIFGPIHVRSGSLRCTFSSLIFFLLQYFNVIWFSFSVLGRHCDTGLIRWLCH